MAKTVALGATRGRGRSAVYALAIGGTEGVVFQLRAILPAIDSIRTRLLEAGAQRF